MTEAELVKVQLDACTKLAREVRSKVRCALVYEPEDTPLLRLVDSPIEVCADHRGQYDIWIKKIGHEPVPVRFNLSLEQVVDVLTRPRCITTDG